MTGPDPAVAATRVAVRAPGTGLGDLPAGALALVACSGGTDSLALAAAAAFEARRRHVRVGAAVVDHALQHGSGEVAERAATVCARLGLEPVHLVRVTVPGSAGCGPEAAARDARHAALERAARHHGAAAVLLGHTRDDQAEQVLLGLARGSGARSLAGMPPARGLLRRPFLRLPREVTRQACLAQGLVAWEDPHNADERYRRVRARTLLRALDDRLGPGVGAALARSAEQLRADADALDQWADTAREQLSGPPWPVTELAALPLAVRSRLLRRLATEAGCPAGAAGAAHVAALEALVTAWHGQGPVWLPGGVAVTRRDGALHPGPPPADGGRPHDAPESG